MKKRVRNGRESRLFGRPPCAKLLATLACLGPMTVRDLARSIGSDSSATWVSTQRFIEAGILHKSTRPGARKRVALDRGFPAYPQVRDLLRALGVRLGLHVDPKNRAGCGSAPTLARDSTEIDLQTLFGSANRGQLLLLLSERGDIDRQDVSELLSVSIYGAQCAIDSLVREGAVRIEPREGLRRRVILDEKYFAHDELLVLLHRIVHCMPEYRKVAQSSRREIGGHRGPRSVKVTRKRLRDPLKRAVRALSFFEAGMARIMILLAASGGRAPWTPLVSRAAAESSVRDSTRRLERAGLVACKEGWVFLRRDPKSFRALLEATAFVEGVAPVTTAAKPPRAPSFEKNPRFDRLTRGGRLRVLAAVAAHPGLTIGDLSRMLSITRRSVRTTLLHFDRAFLIARDDERVRLHSRAVSELPRFLLEAA